MRQWQLGTKFSAYLNMNFKIVSGELGFLVFYSFLYGIMGVMRMELEDMLNFWLCTGFSFLWVLVKCIPKLCKDSMYDSQAMLFQSVPVSEFETVMAKMLIGCTAFMIPLFVEGILLLAGVTYNEDIWDLVYGFLQDQGFAADSLPVSAFLVIWVIAVLAFAVSGICLLAFAAGHHFRGRSSRLQKWVIILILSAVMLAAVTGLLWLTWTVGNVPAVMRLVFIMMVSAGLSVLLVRANLAVLEKWYCI